MRFNADLYVGTNLADRSTRATERPERLPQPRRRARRTGRRACDRKAHGCLASVYGRLDSGGVIAGGELNGFELGPIAFDDSSLALALTPTQQQLRVKGGMRIATRDYEFAEGRADLDISRSGFKFAGDAALFNAPMHGYLKANAPFDLRNPSFEVETWLRADGLAELDNQLGSRLATVQSRLSSIGPLLELINGDRQRREPACPAGRDRAGPACAAPYQVDRDDRRAGHRTGQDRRVTTARSCTLDRAAERLPFDFGGVPGVYSPRVCVGFVVIDGGRAGRVPYAERGTWEPGQCLGEMVNGRLLDGRAQDRGRGRHLRVAGHPSGSDCSWSGLMNRYVAAGAA